MYELVYTSLARSGLKKSEIEAIISTSKKNNRKKGITGCLLYYKREFVQILEGPEEDVKILFEKIKKDPRNLSPKLLYEGSIEAPVFGSWSMAVRIIEDKEVNNIKEILAIEEFRNVQTAIIDNTNTGKELFNYIADSLLGDH